MRILSVSAQKPDSTGSGVYLAQTVASFHDLGVEQAVIAGIAVEDDPIFPDGVLFRPVVYGAEGLPFPVCGMSDSMPYPSTRYRDMDESMVEAFCRAFSSAAARTVEEFRPDVILCHHLYLAAAVVREACPDVYMACVCHSTDLRQMASHGLLRDRITNAMRSLDAVFALHSGQAEEIVEMYGIDPSKVFVVGTGYDDAVFNAQGRRFGRSYGKEISYAGKIRGKKGVPSLLRAVDALPVESGRVRLRLAGGHSTPAEYERIRELAGSNSKTVEFLGKVDQRTLAGLYRDSDLFVLPSFFEGLPLVVIEALACGAPVVMTDLPGVQDWIESNVANAPVRFVKPPRMLDVDTPAPEDLPAFETRLRDAIVESLACAHAPADVTALTWSALCRRILEHVPSA